LELTGEAMDVDAEFGHGMRGIDDVEGDARCSLGGLAGMRLSRQAVSASSWMSWNSVAGPCSS
jgi:hypothetical protein